MFIAIDKITAVKMHGMIAKCWESRITELGEELSTATDDEDRLTLERQLTWMKDTKIAVVISEEQGEVGKFRNWDLDIMPHRRLIKEALRPPNGGGSMSRAPSRATGIHFASLSFVRCGSPGSTLRAFPRYISTNRLRRTR